MEVLLKKHCFILPDFCHWQIDEWKEKNHEFDEIRDNYLGWDITDCGLDDWDNVGFALVTIRNGNQKNPKYQKKYAEKVIMLKEGQRFPMHFHVSKSEDIINRGGGILLITVFNAGKNNERLNSEVKVSTDGRTYFVPAGTTIRIYPGNSITLKPYQYHDFAVEKNTGDVLIGEVSECNDDETDNYFYEDVGRFPDIIEDEKPYRLLCNKYPIARD